MEPPHIALIVTGEKTFGEFQVFAKTLEVWHPDAVLFVLTDVPTAPLFAALKLKMKLHVKATLHRYTGLSRADMEARPSPKYDSLWTEFMYEKAEAMRNAFHESSAGVWFMDADIVHLAPLPAIPDGKTVALSPHSIRASDERLYGRYNGGYLWFATPHLLDVWIAGAAKSRFFEQAALETVAESAGSGLYEFPPSVNFGWWRMYQGSEVPAAIQARFGFNRADRGVGIRYDGAPLQSIHTHLYDKSMSANGVFNRWFAAYGGKFSAHPPLRAFLKITGLS